MCIGVASGGGTLAGGFMLERLLLDSWEWWMWGIAVLPFLVLFGVSSWKLSRMESPADRLAKDMARLKRAIAEPDASKRAAILGYHEVTPSPIRWHFDVPPITRVGLKKAPRRDDNETRESRK